MATAEISTADPGTLANNGTLVRMFQSAISQADENMEIIPRLIRRLIKTNAWREWTTPDGHPFRPHDFRRFIEAKRPGGCETDLNLLDTILRGTDAYPDFLKATVGTPGGANNPDGLGGWSNKTIADADLVNADNMSIDKNRQSSDRTEAAPAPRVPHGTSLSYTLRRLQKQAPELAAKVLAGDLTAHRAAVQAGFAEDSITVPKKNIPQAGGRLYKNLGPEGAEDLVLDLSGRLEPRSVNSIILGLCSRMDPHAVKALIVALSHAAGFTIETD
jgi:hypothetical protein